MDDAAKLNKLALEISVENPDARNNLELQHSADTYMYGAREFMEKKLFTDKPGIVTRLKTQALRRQLQIVVKWLALTVSKLAKVLKRLPALTYFACCSQGGITSLADLAESVFNHFAINQALNPLTR